jgi:hypothetical protein
MGQCCSQPPAAAAGGASTTRRSTQQRVREGEAVANVNAGSADPEHEKVRFALHHLAILTI